MFKNYRQFNRLRVAFLSAAIATFIVFILVDGNQQTEQNFRIWNWFDGANNLIFNAYPKYYVEVMQLESEKDVQLEQARRRLQLVGASLYYFAARQLTSSDIEADYLREGLRDRLTVIKSIANQSNHIIWPLLTWRNFSARLSTTIRTHSAKMQQWIEDFSHYVDSLPSSFRPSTSQSIATQKLIADSALVSLQSRCRQYLELVQFWTTNVTDTLIDRPARIITLTEKLNNQWKRTQYPQDCLSSRVLVCYSAKFCGYGSTVRWMQYCFWIAFLTHRLLYFDTSSWHYTAEPYDNMFQPLTNCTINTQEKVHISASNGREQVVYLKWYDDYEPDYRFRTMPLELERELQLVDLDPFEWLGGLIAQFIVKLQPNVRHRVDDAVRLMNFSHPIVGMHVRRTDKRVEAPYQPLEVYFRAADLYFDQLDGRNSTGRAKRRVFIATDEPKVIKEAIEKYPNYEIFADVQRAKSAATGRTANDSLLYLLIDMYSLLDTDHLVCTMSSNFCSLLHQMRLTDQTKEHTTTFVDGDRWEFYMQRPRYFYVLYPQNADAKHGLIETKVNDTLRYHRFEPDGMIRGENLRTKQVGQFHYFKVSEVFHKIDTNNTLL